VAHPPPGGPVPADVGETLVVVPVGCAEGDLLNRLVHDQTLGLVVHHAEAVTVNVQDGTDRLALRRLKEDDKGRKLSNRKLCCQQTYFLDV
jgi:hypothetical protein